MVVLTDPLELAIFQMRFSRKHNFIFCSTYATMEYTRRISIIYDFMLKLPQMLIPSSQSLLILVSINDVSSCLDCLGNMLLIEVIQTRYDIFPG